MESWMKSLEMSSSVNAVCIDFIKAFGRELHRRLRSKLRQMDDAGNLLKWLGDHLTGQPQRVCASGVNSERETVPSGTFRVQPRRTSSGSTQKDAKTPYPASENTPNVTSAAKSTTPSSKVNTITCSLTADSLSSPPSPTSIITATTAAMSTTPPTPTTVGEDMAGATPANIIIPTTSNADSFPVCPLCDRPFTSGIGMVDHRRIRHTETVCSTEERVTCE
ncbi:hypothetical protein SprV_0401528600 [Sparganum proliferum]